MFTNLSAERVHIQLDIVDEIALAARHGFDAIDLPLARVAGGGNPDEVAAAMQTAGLRWGGFELPLEFRKDRATYDRDFEQLKSWLPLVERLGCDRAYSAAVPGHDELDFAANFSHHVASLKPVAELLADHGVRLAMEFIGPKTLRDTFRYPFIYRIPEMLELCEAISPGRRANEVGVLLDSYHWWTSGATESDLKLLSNDTIVYVHVNDGYAGRTRDQQMDLERTLPCTTGLIDSATFVRALKTLGFDGPVTAEPFDESLQGLPADEIASRVIASTREMLALV